MGNLLSLDSWLRDSDDVIRELPGVYEPVDDLLVGGKNTHHLAERFWVLLESCREGGMKLASNKVQFGRQISFARYMIKGLTVYAEPKKVEAITKYPEPANLKKLRDWFELCNQLSHSVVGLAGKGIQMKK